MGELSGKVIDGKYHTAAELHALGYREPSEALAREVRAVLDLKDGQMLLWTAELQSRVSKAFDGTEGKAFWTRHRQEMTEAADAWRAAAQRQQKKERPSPSIPAVRALSWW